MNELTVLMSVVSEYYLKVAQDELREDDFRRSQSLDQFREFVCKHPAIKKCRSGEKVHLSLSELIQKFNILQMIDFCCNFYEVKSFQLIQH